MRCICELSFKEQQLLEALMKEMDYDMTIEGLETISIQHAKNVLRVGVNVKTTENRTDFV